MAKVCLFCGEYIIQGFTSCGHNWAWREVDDDVADNFCDSLKARNKLSLKDNMRIKFDDAILCFDNVKEQNINGINVYDFEEKDLTVYVSKNKKKVIAFSNSNVFRVGNIETSVIDLLYENDDKKRISLFEEKVETKHDKKEKCEKQNETVEGVSCKKNTAKKNVINKETKIDAQNKNAIEQSEEKEEQQTFEYAGCLISKENLVSKINELKDKIYSSVQATQEFLEVLQNNEKLLLPANDSRYMSKFRAVMQELYLCPSLSVFMYALHGTEASKVGKKYTLYPVYDNYYGIIAFVEKGLKEIKDAYRFRKYWSTRAEADCYELIVAPAVKTVFTDYYLPKVLTFTAISATDRKILNNPIGGNTQKQNLLEYIGC